MPVYRGHALSFRTILVHLDESPSCTARLDLACTLALAQRGHLIGLVPSGLTRVAGQNTADSAQARYLQAPARAAAQRAAAISARFERVAGARGLVSFEARVHDADSTASVLTVGCCADLVVIGQDDPAAWNPFAPSVEQVLVGLGRPALVVPRDGARRDPGRNVLVAWDTSPQATRALALALPLLVRAHRVHVVVLRDAAVPSPLVAAALRDLGRALERHGVRVELGLFETGPAVAPTLLSRAADLGVDLIVMGAFGHNRVREWILGGATRDMLDRATVPLLLSH
jgi:nucleotide-binding universal stress UspA family protein